MEQELLPSVLETCDELANTFKQFERLQQKRLEALQGGEAVSPQSERRYQKVQAQLSDLMRTVRLHNNRIEALVDQVYGLNRRMMTMEGSLDRKSTRLNSSH